MKIACKLHREGGTKVELNGTEYHFEPQADGTHVADVTDESHIAIFLAIPEGYKIHGSALSKATKKPVDQTDELATDSNGDGNADGAEELADLREQYEAKFGKAPHHAMKADTIRAKLAE